jgi:hypothetical protein
MATLTLGVSALLSVSATTSAAVAADEPIGKVSQPIIAGTPVSLAQQEELGLIVVANSCSGTLLNQYWVLTADHCVTTDGTRGGPDQTFAQLPITAAWRSGSVTPTDRVRYYASKSLDVALLFLGRGDFGKRNTRLIYHDPVDTSMLMTKFGRGFSTFATGSGPTATQGVIGPYLSARFTPSSASETDIAIVPNADGQIAAAGDSGGPDYVTDGDGNLLSIAGVQSTCNSRGYIAGQPTTATWATGFSGCDSAALFQIRDDIVLRMKEVPPPVDVVSKPPGGGLSDVVTKPDIVSKPPGSGVLTMTANCAAGFVWRAARPEDLVCVTPEARARTAQENASAKDHVDPAGAYGPNTCVSGYVWRNAFDGDVVCVTPQVRDLVLEENRLGPSRLAR